MQVCVLALTILGILLSTLLHDAFANCEEGFFTHTKADGKLFNMARLCATVRAKVRQVLIQEMLIKDDAAVMSHAETGPQDLVNGPRRAC
ncbi:hypothetical protein ElyMa_004962600 [Elysia marginata]|uniref:Secreted protein n=1 Tax=Elysia marginata TaxID=1093978 RepID=A0AAV4J319_9GAST|nr:hypothetical protein ElyMa_004962600 [Elysia marginata]